MIGNTAQTQTTTNLQQPNKPIESVHSMSIGLLDTAILVAGRLETLVDKLHGQHKAETNSKDCVPTMPIPENLSTAQKALGHALTQISYLETTLFNN